MMLRNGRNSFDIYSSGDYVDPFQKEDSESSPEPSTSRGPGKRTRTKTPNNGFVDSSVIPLNSDDESITKKRRLEKGRVSFLTTDGTRQSSRRSSRQPSRTIHDDSTDSEDQTQKKRGTQPSRSSTRKTRSAQTRLKLTDSRSRFEDEDDDELAGEAPESEDSDIVYEQRKPHKRNVKEQQGRSETQPKRGRGRKALEDSSSSSPEQPTRRSGRERVVKNMKEQDMDEEIYADEPSVQNTPKVISIREVYQPLAKDSPFRLMHNTECDVCNGVGTHSNKGTSPLIHCQGCSTSIHKICLGYRSGREHIVTKIGHDSFVMQCRRCIGNAVKKDARAPRLDCCQTCKNPGVACASFSPRRTAKQEEKLREENEGDDPITEVSEDLINNPGNVLFRCIGCQLAFHFEHLPPLSSKSRSENLLDSELISKRFNEYSRNWQCKQCLDAPAKVQGLVAWRTINHESYLSDQTANDFREDEKEYLIKWEDKSYFKCTWVPGGWVWGVTTVNMRNAFWRRDEGVNLLPKWTNEEAIPEEYLRMEIILDVSYNSTFRPKSEAVDKASTGKIDEVYVKFQGLSYEEAVWEEPPDPEDEPARWKDFVLAYNEYIAGQYFKQAPIATMKERVDIFRSTNFEKRVELKKQPSSLIGGEIMPYQLDGLNWLLYNFHQKKNVILADEMGLGKTIQIISLIASLVKDNPKVSR